MSIDYKDKLIDKYWEFYLENDSKKKIVLREEILKILNFLSPPDPDDLHTWGLTYYMSDDDKEYHKKLALNKFLEAFEQDDTHFLACLYAAHCYHDRGDLIDALKYYELVDKDALKEHELWIFVKLLEQIGFCNYKLGNEELGKQQFQDVYEWYTKLTREERPNPTEMFQCLSKTDELVKQMEDLIM